MRLVLLLRKAAVQLGLFDLRPAPPPAAPLVEQAVVVHQHVRRTKTGELVAVQQHQAHRRKLTILRQLPRTDQFGWMTGLVERVIEAGTRGRAGQPLHKEQARAIAHVRKVAEYALADPARWARTVLRETDEEKAAGGRKLPPLDVTRRQAVAELQYHVVDRIQRHLFRDGDESPYGDWIRMGVSMAGRLVNRSVWNRPGWEAKWQDYVHDPLNPKSIAGRKRQSREMAAQHMRVAAAETIEEAMPILIEGNGGRPPYQHEIDRMANAWPQIRLENYLTGLAIRLKERQEEPGLDPKSSEAWNARHLLTLTPPKDIPGLELAGDNSIEDEIVDIIRVDLQNGQKGHHWGESRPENPVARMVSGLANKGIRSRADMTWHAIPELSGVARIKALAYRKFAQEQLKALDAAEKKKRLPPGDRSHTLHRGMRVPAAVAEALVAGAKPTLPMTGCTAFTFDRHVAEEYTKSDWARQTSALHGRETITVPVVLHLARSKSVDKSIAFWHLNKSDPRGPAFEVLTTLTEAKVTAAHRDNYDGTYHVYLETETP